MLFIGAVAITGCRSQPPDPSCPSRLEGIADTKSELRVLEAKKSNDFSLFGYLGAPLEGAKAGGLKGALVTTILYPFTTGNYTQADEDRRVKTEQKLEAQMLAAKKLGCVKRGGSSGLGNALQLF